MGKAALLKAVNDGVWRRKGGGGGGKGGEGREDKGEEGNEEGQGEGI